MLVAKEHVEELKAWLAEKLKTLSDADPVSLAKYVLALVNKNVPETELKQNCIDMLDIFIGENTKKFIEEVFGAIESKEYLIKQKETGMPPKDEEKEVCLNGTVSADVSEDTDELGIDHDKLKTNQPSVELDQTISTMSDDGSEGSAEVSREASPLEGLLEDIDESKKCQICEEQLKQPKILDCLHVFCQSCLEKTYKEQCEANGRNLVLECTVCKQETKLSDEKGVEGLATEYVLTDMLETVPADEMQIVCTSCKAKEEAVARCNDCASFLCSNCVTAHKFMRCFDKHKVVSFDVIHKSVFCNVHPYENIKYFCSTCQFPVCMDCVSEDHKQHNYEKISDVEETHRRELKVLVEECKKKVESCSEAYQSLENSLGELQMQRDNAKGLIQESFQSYKAALEERRDELLQELEDIHSSQELAIMDLFQQVGKTSEKLEDGMKYTDMVLEHGTGLHVGLAKKMIVTQLLSLLNNTPKTDVTVNIEFHSKSDGFKEAVNRSFGSFSKEEPKLERPLSSLQSSFENEGFTMPSRVISPDHPLPLKPPTPQELYGNAHEFRTITPVSMGGTMQPPIGTLPTSAPVGGAPVMPERTCLSRNSHSPAMSDSGISVGNTSNNSGTGAPISMNVAALAKMGFPPQAPLPPVSGVPTPPATSTGDPTISNYMNFSTSLPPAPKLGFSEELDTLSRLMTLAPPSVDNIGNSVRSKIGVPYNSLMNQHSAITPPVDSVSQQPPQLRSSSKKMSAMQIRCKFGQLGPGKGQFNSPHGFCLGCDEDIIVADTNNHRVQVFEKTGEFKYQFGIPGREEGQLWYPRKVAVQRSTGRFVVCDRGSERSRMQIFSSKGSFMRKIAIRYIDIVAGLVISSKGHIVAVDSVSPTVFCISDAGDLIKWFDCSDYMREPSDIALTNKEYYVCDFKGHCVVVFNEDGQFLRRIGCENITNYPNGIDISDDGDVLVGDSHGNRFHVAVFQRDGSLIGEFECPYVKVSRCCGLKITAEGYIVTLAKNNHHVLVLNTLYIT